MTPDLPSPSEDPDVQEALSQRYVNGIIVMPLSSGRWAIFARSGQLLRVDQELDLGLLRELDFVQGEQWSARQVAEFAQRSEEPIVTKAALGDLDL